MFSFVLAWSLILAPSLAQLDRDVSEPPIETKAKHNTPAFCDTGADRGTSASCKAAAPGAGVLVCPAGYHVVNLNCSPKPTTCTAGGQPGTYCTCTYGCREDL